MESNTLENTELEQLTQEDAGSVTGAESVIIPDSEWCFQFFDNEPIVFGWQDVDAEPSPLVLKIEPVEGEGLTFKQNGMRFRIFPRPISEVSFHSRKNKI